MPYDTLTVKRANQKNDNATFQITAYELKTTAFCDCCDATETGTKTQIQHSVRTFGSGSEFCPECNF